MIDQIMQINIYIPIKPLIIVHAPPIISKDFKATLSGSDVTLVNNA